MASRARSAAAAAVAMAVPLRVEVPAHSVRLLLKRHLIGLLNIPLSLYTADEGPENSAPAAL